MISISLVINLFTTGLHQQQMVLSDYLSIIQCNLCSAATIIEINKSPGHPVLGPLSMMHVCLLLLFRGCNRPQKDPEMLRKLRGKLQGSIMCPINP